MTAPDPRALLDALDEAHAKATISRWRIGEHYGIHLYAKDRPVGTTLVEDDAELIVAAVNALPALTAAVRAALALADKLEREDSLVHNPATQAQRRAARELRATVTAALTGGQQT